MTLLLMMLPLVMRMPLRASNVWNTLHVAGHSGTKQAYSALARTLTSARQLGLDDRGSMHPPSERRVYRKAVVYMRTIGVVSPSDRGRALLTECTSDAFRKPARVPGRRQRRKRAEVAGVATPRKGRSLEKDPSASRLIVNYRAEGAFLGYR